MEPLFIPAIANALLAVANKLAEKAVIDPALEKGLEPFKAWLTRDYDRKKADAELRKAFAAAIKPMGAAVKDDDQLIQWLKKFGLERLQAENNEALRRQVALALISFTDEKAPPPAGLMLALGWPRSRQGELAALLAGLRAGLAGTSWQPLLDYAGEAERRGQMRVLLERVLLIANAIVSTPEGAALRVALVEKSRLSDEETYEIEREYRALVADDFRMHSIQGLVQVDAMVTLPLQDIYHELGLRPLSTPREQEEGLAAMLEDGIAGRLERSLKAAQQRVSGALPASQRLVILGKPGSGKTISLKFIALMLAMGEAGAGRLGLNAPYLPIYLRLAQYARGLLKDPELSLEAYLHEYLSKRFASLPHRDLFLAAALQNGACLLLLDGLDEVGDIGEKLSSGLTLRQIVLREVGRFASQRCGERCANRLVVSSRLEGYRMGDLPGFTEVELDFLRLPDEVEAFLLRWFGAYIQEKDKALSPRAAQNQAAESVAAIMAAIVRSESVSLLAMNPLLLTILAVISVNLHTPLPNRRAELYRIVAETMVKNWRYAQTEHESRIYQERLQASDVYYILAALAYWLHENQPGGAMPEAEWRRQLTRLLGEYGEAKEISTMVNEFIHHARHETGLLTERSPGQIGFFHLTLEEYLAAVELARQDGDRRLEMIARHWQDPYWQETLLLTAGELEQRGNRDVLASYLTCFLNFEPAQPAQAGRNVFLAGRALADLGPRSIAPAPLSAVKRSLKCVAQDLEFDGETPNRPGLYPPPLRADAADTLDELGWLPDDLYAFLPIPFSPVP
ncbi:MAG: NACHT domain-containing protein, partial [Chloroflexi bacterium]|nr:NACHT domain-containing protein [Chloroflexota bacterium]